MADNYKIRGIVESKGLLLTGVTNQSDIYVQENVVGAGTTTIVASGSTLNMNAIFFDYVVKYNTNIRAGYIIAVHNGNGDLQHTDVSTVSVGNTDAVFFNFEITDNNWILNVSSIEELWTVKTLVRTL